MSKGKKLFSFRRTTFKSFRKTEKIKLERTESKCPLEEVMTYKYTDLDILSYSPVGRLKGKGEEASPAILPVHITVCDTYL